jgi:hypothetical protein
MPLASPIVEPGQDALTASGSVRTKTYVLVLAVVWLLSLMYMAASVKRGWVPHDEGTLGLSAERVLQGQLPHRDFDDYTGGLTFVHAMAFRLLGINSASMRIVLFAFFVPWVPAVFYAASRFCRAHPAGVVTLLAVAWSVPHYPGPMPSWYNLFFATFGLAALLRYLETNSWKWVFLAGLCGGCSMLAKVTGAYYIAAALLFFVFREQRVTGKAGRGTAKRAWFYSSAVALMLGIFLLLLFRMVHKVPGAGGLFFFVLPSMVLAGLLVARELRVGSGANGQRLKVLLTMCVPFGAGVVIPWMLFVIPYVSAGATHDLVQGLVATPTRALRFAAIAPLNPLAVTTALPFSLALLLAYDLRGLPRAICGGILAVFSGIMFFLSTKYLLIYGIGWGSLGTAVPTVVAVGACALGVRGRQKKLSSLQQEQLMLVLCMAALCSLVQFPFAGQGYFLYVAPLVIVAAASVLAAFPDPPKLALGAIAVFYLLFGIISVTPYHMGLEREEHTQVERLTLPRAGGLRVEAAAARIYEEIIPVVESHAAGRFIYAAPDCPEVYFLSGKQSPSRHYFEYAEDEPQRDSSLLKKLEELKVSVVAINRDPLFSPMMSQELKSELEKHFPYSAENGKFTVRWKD